MKWKLCAQTVSLELFYYIGVDDAARANDNEFCITSRSVLIDKVATCFKYTFLLAYSLIFSYILKTKSLWMIYIDLCYSCLNTIDTYHSNTEFNKTW